MFRFEKTPAAQDAEWLTLVDIGTGDGSTTDFPLPENTAKDDDILLFVDGVMANRPRNDEPIRATIITPSDGARAARFENAPRFGADVKVGLVGVEGETAIKVRYGTVTLEKQLAKKIAEVRKNKKLVEDSHEDILNQYPIWFDLYVSDWKGFEDADGTPHPCNSEMKTAFIENVDSGLFGGLVRQVANWLQRRRVNHREAEVRD